MKTKLLGGFLFLLSVVALLVFVADIWPVFSSEAPLLATVIPALKYWAISELAGGIGIVFLFFAPDRPWTWQAIFSLEWWQAEWLLPVFRILLLGALAFLVVAILLDFVYKLGLASNWL